VKKEPDEGVLGIWEAIAVTTYKCEWFMHAAQEFEGSGFR
jgi:hypothetical protein